MASLPQKGMTGENFKSWAVNSINQLIDYLNAMRVRKGTGIEVSETPSGVVISLAKPQNQTPQVASTGGGGTTYGIEATIDGSTASVALVEGGTSSRISLIPTAPVTMTAGANGELIIGSTASGGGIGAPDYSHKIDVLNYANSAGQWKSYNRDVWLLGIVTLFVKNTTTAPQINIDFRDGSTTIWNYILASLTGPISGDGLTVSSPVMLPVAANVSFRLTGGYPPGDNPNLSTEYFITVLATH